MISVTAIAEGECQPSAEAGQKSERTQIVGVSSVTLFTAWLASIHPSPPKRAVVQTASMPVETIPRVQAMTQMPRRSPVVRRCRAADQGIQKAVQHEDQDCRGEQRDGVWTLSRLLRSNTNAIAVIRNPPSTPASCEIDDAEVTTLHWSELHDWSGSATTRRRLSLR